MEAQRIERKLAAILATDVKGYSRLASQPPLSALLHSHFG